MRYRIKDYTISGQTITIQGEFDIEDIRLIVDETQKEILCSSTDKNLDGVVYDSGLDATIITIPLSICRLVNTDKLTIEVDCGDSPVDLARQGSNVEATNSKILEEVSKLHDFRIIYSARFEKNNDGEDTWTMVLPMVAGVDGTTLII